ncbi:MAG: AbrB family transcriptional regulator [Deltaproteobacteria bacterium]|jgi:membrane AbrB-like protein|nr:AbrB family transcriptional regulator [Deltaproteobacteria bacterium]
MWPFIRILLTAAADLRFYLILLRRWILLSLFSVLLTMGLDYVHFPAARFLGPLWAAVFLSLANFRLSLHPRLYPCAQGLIGILVASSLTPRTWSVLGQSWPFLVGGTVWSILASAVIGIGLYRFKVLPASAAVWGLSPGAAGVMTVMSGDYGADMRLVAFAQYLRVLMVSMAAVGVARLAASSTGGGAAAADFFPPVLWPDILAALLALFFGLGLTKLADLPGGLILLPMAMGILAENFLGLDVTPPPWIMVPAYAVIGWRIGLTFDRDTVIRTVKLLPAVCLAILILIAACGLYAVLMIFWGGFDPLTAYLASSPGGLDAVTIIASSSGADLPLVMAMQACRLIIVIATAPCLARYISKKRGLSPPKPPSENPPPSNNEA